MRIAGLLSVAGCGTLVGHAATYLLEGRTMDDGRHGYFSAVLELAIAAGLLCAVIAIARLLAGAGGARGYSAPPLPALCAALAALQVAGFATLELSEGNAPDPIGCGVEILAALLIAVAVSLVLAFVERCVLRIVATYLRRRSAPHAKLTGAPFTVVRPSWLLAVRTGVRRFKRPPPIFG